MTDIKDLSGLGEPAGKLIDAFRAVSATLFLPSHIRRVAKAKAESAILIAEGEAAATEIAARTRRRIEADDVRHQANLEAIAERASHHLPAKLPSASVDPDWVFHFRDEAKNTSNEDMQELWGRLLAGEMANPGRFSRRTVSLLRLLDPADAKEFAKLCQYIIADGLLMVDWSHSRIRNQEFRFEVLEHLESIGLIRFNSLAGYSLSVSVSDVKVPLLIHYHNEVLRCDMTRCVPESPGEFRVALGNCLFTKQGREVSMLVERIYSPDILRYLVESIGSQNAPMTVSVADQSKTK